MSALLFPTLPGLTWDSQRTARWRTNVIGALSGKESRVQLMQYPLIGFDLSFELLRDYLTVSELRSLVGLFMQMRGRGDTFLYTDPTFNTLTDEPFGTGDTATTAFQLVAAFQNSGGPGAPELIQNLNGTPTIKKAGVVQSSPSQYSVGATGLVTFVTAPAAGAALTWSGSFYYRCRFDDDDLSAQQFLQKLWQSKRVTFSSVKL